MGNGVSIDEFRAVSAGKWNVGSVVLKNTESGSSLQKVNNHKWNKVANKTKVTDEQNRDVREAFYDTLLKTMQEKLGVRPGEDIYKPNPHARNPADQDTFATFREEILGAGNVNRTLDREKIGEILSRFDNMIVRELKKGKHQEQDYQLSDAWIKSTATRLGLSSDAVNRYVNKEREAIQFLMHQFAAGQEAVNAQELFASAIARLAAKDQSLQTGLNDAEKNACKALNEFFTDDVRTNAAKRAEAISLVNKLNALAEPKVKSVKVVDNNGSLELLKLTDGTLALKNGNLQKSLGIPVAGYARALEKNLAAKIATLEDNDARAFIADGLLARWNTAVHNQNVPQVLKNHCREVATAILSSDGDAKAAAEMAANCDRLKLEDLMGYLSDWATGTSVSDLKGTIQTKVNEQRFPPFQSVEVEEMIEARPREKFVARTAKDAFPGTAAEWQERRAKDLREAQTILSELAFHCQLGDGKFAGTIKKYAPQLLAMLQNCCTEDLYSGLSPAAQKILDRMIGVVRRKVEDVVTLDAFFDAPDEGDPGRDGIFSWGLGSGERTGATAAADAAVELLKVKQGESSAIKNGKAVLKALLMECYGKTILPETFRDSVVWQGVKKDNRMRGRSRPNGFDVSLLLIGDVLGPAEGKDASFAALFTEAFAKGVKDDLTKLFDETVLGRDVEEDDPSVPEGRKTDHIPGLAERLERVLGAKGYFDVDPDDKVRVTGAANESYACGAAFDVLRPHFPFLQRQDADPRNLYQSTSIEDYTIRLVNQGIGDVCKRCIRSVVQPESYSPKTLDATLKADAPLPKPYFSADTFDLLAATITSPKTIRARFPEGQKPSVSGAHSIVRTMLKNFVQACRMTSVRGSGSDEDGESKGLLGGLKDLRTTLSRAPLNLSWDVLNNLLSIDEIKEIVNQEKDPEAFLAFLSKLPTPVVSEVLKVFCRWFVAGAAKFANREKHAHELKEFADGYLNPVYEQMRDWRARMKSMKGVEGDLFKVPEGSGSKEVLFDQLDPDRVETLKDSRGEGSNDGFRLVRQLLPEYLRTLPPYLKAKAIAGLVNRSGNGRQGADGIDWDFFRGMIEGCGPIMQKYLQGFELPADAPLKMRDAFNALKSDLPLPTMDYVNAQLDHIKELSGGRISEIKFESFIGAATIGVAVRCRVKTVDDPEGSVCVVKLIRPDARLRMNEEEKHIENLLGKMQDRDVAKRLADVNADRIESIRKEFDFVREFDGLGQGAVYDSREPGVSSVKAFPFVVPEKSFVIMKCADGSTVDSHVRATDSLTHEFQPIRRRITDRYRFNGQTKALESKQSHEWSDDYSDAADWARRVAGMLETRKELVRARAQLVSAAKVWFDEALKGEGFYHGDLHAGNIMTGVKGATLIDFGNFSRLPSVTRAAIAKIYAGVWKGKKGVSRFVSGLKELDESTFGNLGEDVKAELGRILGKGKSPEEVFARLQKALDYLSVEKGLKLPGTLSDFIQAQTRLMNSLRDVDKSIRRLDEMIKASNWDDDWGIDKWPVSSSVRKTHMKATKEFSRLLGAHLFGKTELRGETQATNAVYKASRKVFQAAAKKIKDYVDDESFATPSFESVIGERVKGLK